MCAHACVEARVRCQVSPLFASPSYFGKQHLSLNPTFNISARLSDQRDVWVCLLPVFTHFLCWLNLIQYMVYAAYTHPHLLLSSLFPRSILNSYLPALFCDPLVLTVSATLILIRTVWPWTWNCPLETGGLPFGSNLKIFESNGYVPHPHPRIIRCL